VLGLLAGTVAPAAARARFPRHIDPRSWVVPEDMTWGDYRPIPGVDWREGDADPPKTLRAALILGDFQDQGFRVSETSVDPTGQRGLGIDDPAAYWRDYLFYDTDPTAPQRGHTVGEYWLENSYGLIGVDAEAFGPYTMEGNMYEYGIRDFGGDADCPDGPDGCQGDFDTEAVQASLVDVTASVQEHGDFDFRFLLHAGYDESGVWLNYGQARFPTMEAVTDPFGPVNPDHRNWATTRYVPWTSFFSAQQIWSHALPGLLSTQGESDGGSTYAHELSHILGVLDNYNNPYATNPIRTYSGPWDMMSRGTFNGPGGPFERNLIPPTKGGTMGSHHMLRNKVRMGFIPASEVLTINQAALDATGIVTGRILQRESPPDTTDPDIHSGLRIVLDGDASDCDSAKPKCDRGGYDFYDIEVVNRQGFDSFLPDHGVLIAKTKAADASPFIWVIDAFPADIGGIDYVMADGTEVPYTVGDYRQLADSAFHAGTAPKTRNTYVDRANNLAFYILAKQPQRKRLTYTVAVQSLTATLLAEEAEVTKTAGRPIPRQVTKMTFEVTNPGSGPGIYRLKAQRHGSVKARLLNDLIYLEGGQTKNVVVWVKKVGSRGSVMLKAALEQPS
jgi:M6 family metalloprotease-like protein